MTLIALGIGLFVFGAVINGIGWAIDKRSKKSITDPWLEWLLSTIRQWFKILTRRSSTTGERVAAFGAILSALGLVVTVVGIAVLAVA